MSPFDNGLTSLISTTFKERRVMGAHRTCYDVLGVSRKATQEEIQKRYKDLFKAFHPDRFASKPDTVRKEMEEKLDEILTAYNVLGDVKRRSEYDQNLEWFEASPPPPPPPPPQPKPNFSSQPPQYPPQSPLSQSPPIWERYVALTILALCFGACSIVAVVNWKQHKKDEIIAWQNMQKQEAEQNRQRAEQAAALAARQKAEAEEAAELLRNTDRRERLQIAEEDVYLTKLGFEDAHGNFDFGRRLVYHYLEAKKNYMEYASRENADPVVAEFLLRCLNLGRNAAWHIDYLWVESRSAKRKETGRVVKALNDPEKLTSRERYYALQDCNPIGAKVEEYYDPTSGEDPSSPSCLLAQRILETVPVICIKNSKTGDFFRTRSIMERDCWFMEEDRWSNLEDLTPCR